LSFEVYYLAIAISQLFNIMKCSLLAIPSKSQRRVELHYRFSNLIRYLSMVLLLSGMNSIGTQIQLPAKNIVYISLYAFGSVNVAVNLGIDSVFCQELRAQKLVNYGSKILDYYVY